MIDWQPLDGATNAAKAKSTLILVDFFSPT